MDHAYNPLQAGGLAVESSVVAAAMSALLQHPDEARNVGISIGWYICMNFLDGLVLILWKIGLHRGGGGGGNDTDSHSGDDGKPDRLFLFSACLRTCAWLPVAVVAVKVVRAAAQGALVAARGEARSDTSSDTGWELVPDILPPLPLPELEPFIPEMLNDLCWLNQRVGCFWPLGRWRAERCVESGISQGDSRYIYYCFRRRGPEAKIASLQ